MATALLVTALAGCDLFTARHAQHYEVIYIDGCALLVKATDLEQFNEKDVQWTMGEDCTVSKNDFNSALPSGRATIDGNVSLGGKKD